MQPSKLCLTRKAFTFCAEFVVTIAIVWLAERCLTTSLKSVKMAGGDLFCAKELRQILTNSSTRCSGTSHVRPYDANDISSSLPKSSLVTECLTPSLSQPP